MGPFRAVRDQVVSPRNPHLQSPRAVGPLLSKWVQNTPSNFKTGAIDHSATPPDDYFEELMLIFGSAAGASRPTDGRFYYVFASVNGKQFGEGVGV